VVDCYVGVEEDDEAVARQDVGDCVDFYPGVVLVGELGGLEEEVVVAVDLCW
jgi:hypothetical protein